MSIGELRDLNLGSYQGTQRLLLSSFRVGYGAARLAVREP
jgi:hypothetical protein